MFSNRQMELLKMIMNNPQGIFGAALAEAFSLSSRTIRTEIREINKEELLVSSDQKNGYYIADEQSKKVQELLYAFRTEQSSDEIEKRVFVLLGILAFRERLDLYDLCEVLHFSEQTVKTDLVRLQKMIDEVEIPVQVEVKGSSIRLEYEEWAIRKLYHKIFMKYTYSINDSVMEQLLYHYYDNDEYEGMFELIRDYFRHTDIFLTDDELFMIVDAVYICIVRNDCGYLTEKQSTTIKFSTEIEHLLQFFLENKLNITLNDYDNLGRFFSTLKITKNTEEEISNFTLFLYEEFCDEVLEKYCLDFRNDKVFAGKLIVHLEYMTRRIENEEQAHNPLLDKIRQEYPYAHEISILMVHLCYKYMGKYIRDDEVAFISLYIAHYLQDINQKLRAVLVVSSRKSFISVTENWIEKHFQHTIRITRSVPAYLLEDHLAEEEPDLILSTSGQLMHPVIPVFQIQGIPTDREKEALTSMIRKIRSRSRYKNLIYKLFHEDLVKIYEQPVSFGELIHELSVLLEQQDRIEDWELFARDVIRREENYPTHLNESFMIPHPLTSFAKKSAVAAAILKCPLRIHGQMIRIVFVTAIEQKQDSDIGVMFDLFKHLAGEKEMLNRMNEAADTHDFMKLVLEMTSFAEE